MTTYIPSDFTITRFAPSPTGFLHLGHAYSALFAEEKVKLSNGIFILRIEDIDFERSQKLFEKAIYEDLDWLGLKWLKPVRRQSDHMEDYSNALKKLKKMGILYPCFCSRKDIQEATRAPHQKIQGPDGIIYPGTCRDLSLSERTSRVNSGELFALRLNMKKAINSLSKTLYWNDLTMGQVCAKPEIFGDVVLGRKNIPTSYHLAVTVDDHLQGISMITRGEDLFQLTHIHRLLQELLDLRVPNYHHHRLLKHDNGVKFSKRDRSTTIKAMREQGRTPNEVRNLVGFK